MPIAFVRAVWVASTVFGCAASTPERGTSVRTDPVQTSPLPSAAHGAPAVAPRETAGPAPPAEVRAFPFALERVDARPVTSLAFGKPPRVAILTSGEVSILDGQGRRSFAAPPIEDGELTVELFFGRDDQPRLMGGRRSLPGAESFYRRLKVGRFQPEPAELGPLATGGGVLYGVLGHADPELVCKPALFCLVKRVSGWTRAPSHPEPVRIRLAGSDAWALHADRIERLERDRWVPLEPQRAWDSPASLFVDVEGSIWVVEASRRVLRLVKDRWEVVFQPVAEPLAMAGSAQAGIWLVGQAGAAHFDGEGWSEAPALPGPLHLVGVSGEDVWLAGGSGLFRAQRKRP